jgi:hypothetical protein
MKDTITWRWINHWEFPTWKLRKVWNDEDHKKYSNYPDFELPEFTSKDEISKIEKMGPGIKSWFYIKWLFFKYR